MLTPTCAFDSAVAPVSIFTLTPVGAFSVDAHGVRNALVLSVTLINVCKKDGEVNNRQCHGNIDPNIFFRKLRQVKERAYMTSPL